MTGGRRNRRLQPTELWVEPKVHPKNRRLTYLERRLGYRSRSRAGVLTDFALEVVFPGVTLVALFILALITFFL